MTRASRLQRELKKRSEFDSVAQEAWLNIVRTASRLTTRFERLFAGFGLTSSDPPYDDYAGIDVKGKVVVVLRHGEGLESRYHHLGDIAVRPGQRLSKGERLGSIGETGKTTGPHVHVELREHGVAIDPSPIVD